MTVKEIRSMTYLINHAGVDVLKVVGSEEPMYFAVASFSPPIEGGIQSSPYAQVTGVEITDILTSGLISDSVSCINKVKDFFQNQKRVELQFCKNHHWEYFKAK